MTNDITDILADARGDASVIRKSGQTAFADYIVELCDKIDDATEDYRVFLSEPEAVLQSGRAGPWFRSRFPDWLADGNARLNARKEREYRAIIVPRRANVSAAREAGQRAAERSA